MAQVEGNGRGIVLGYFEKNISPRGRRQPGQQCGACALAAMRWIDCQIQQLSFAIRYLPPGAKTHGRNEL